MTEITYIQLLNKTLDYYFKEKYEEGFEFLSKNKDKVKGNQAQLYNFQYTLACKIGEVDKAIELLKEAVYDKGFWYATDYLKADDDLDPIRDKKEFKKIVKVCKKREEEAKDKAKSKLKVYLPENNKKDNKKPLFITLHGNQENIKIVEDYWKAVLNQDIILALSQSSQIEFHEAYVWDDVEVGVRELKHHFNNIISNYNVDLDNIILGGFSAGARVILEAVNKDIIKPKGIVLMAPWLPDIKQNQKLFKKLKEIDTKVYIICGKEDKDCLEYCEILSDKLEQSNVDYKYELIEELDHDYPKDFSIKLKKAINYIKE